MCKTINFELKGATLINARLMTVNTDNEVVINRVIKTDTNSIVSDRCVIGANDYFITVVLDKLSKKSTLFAYAVIDIRTHFVNPDEDTVAIDGATYLMLVKKNLTQLSRDKMTYCKILSIIDEAKHISQYADIQNDDALEA